MFRRFILPVAAHSISAICIAMLASYVRAEPFSIESMPDGFDGVVHAWGAARSPVAADFNGDGQPSWYAGGHQVAHPKAPTPLDPARFANAPLPTISLPVCPSCTPRPLAFAVADFNRDGKTDILRLNAWNGHSFVYTLQLFAGNGSNGFVLASRLDWNYDIGANVGDIYFQMRAADFNRDGQPDIALLITAQNTNDDVNPFRDEGSLRIRLNDNGAFPAESLLQGDHFNDESALVVADLDRDGDQDILVDRSTTWTPEETYSFATRVFRNNGAASFTASTDGSILVPIGFADIDRDRWADYLFFGYSGGCGATICMRTNDGSGGFDSWWWPYASYTGGINPVAWAVVDVDEDGRPDFIAAEGDSPGQANRLTLHRSVSDTGAGPAEALGTLPANIVQIGVGDAKGDADADLLLRLANGSFRFVRNTAQRLFVRADNSFSAAALNGLAKLGVADSNRDGIDDLFALQPNGPRLHRALGNVGGGFDASEFKILAGATTDFTLADFSGDARTDIAYVVPSAGQVRTVTQIDNIYFSWTDAKIADVAGAALVETGEILIRDGDPDLFVGSSSDGALKALRNNGNGSSWSVSTPRAAYGVAPDALVLVPNYASISDAVFACNSDDIVFAIEGYSVVLGWSRSARALQVQSVPQTGHCATANLDHDAEREIVFVSGDGRLVSWSPANDDIVVTQTIDTIPPGLVNAVTAVDWNRDGLDDLLVATSTGLHVYTREGLDESWAVRTLYNAAPVAVSDVVAVDVDRDSRPDAAFVTSTGIRVVRNLSSIVSAGPGSTPSGMPLVLAPGQTGTAFAIAVTNPGRFDEDAQIAVTGSRVLFQKAVESGGSFSPGAAMTKAEVEQAVASVSLLMNGLVIGTSGTSAVQPDGSLAIAYNSVLGNAVPIAPDTSNSLMVRVALKATAGSASYSDFYLSHASGEPGTARVMRGAVPDGRSGSFGAAASNRVQIQTSPPSTDIFEDGFE